MKKFFITASVLSVLFFSGCKVTQEYHFNKNLSGTYKFEMEMGDLINMMQSMDTTGKFMSSIDTLDKSFTEIAEKYKAAGAKNVQVGWKDDKTTMYVNFDFSNIENLNSILKNSGKESGMSLFSGNSDTPGKFTHKGKRDISVDFPEFKNDTVSMKDLASMKDYISIETIFSFDRRIKSIDNKNAVISDDKKSFKFSGKLDDMLKKDFSTDTHVKLKFK